MMKGPLRECHLILSAQVSGRQQRPYREGHLRRVSVVRELLKELCRARFNQQFGTGFRRS